MSFIRGAVITLFGLVLTICILLMNVSITFASSLDYDDLKPALDNSANGVIDSIVDFEEVFGEELNNYCNIDSQYTFNYGNESFAIPCEVIEEGEDSIAIYIQNNFIEQIYYADYNCKFWECVKESEVPFVLISDKARVYWAGKAILLAIMSLVLFGLIFLVAENRPSKFISFGILLALCSLPFKNMNWILKIVPAQVAPLFSLFSQKAHTVFVIMLIISIILALIGIVALIFGWKMKFKEENLENKKSASLNQISREEIREMIREELYKKDISKKKTNKSNLPKKKRN
ncbi:MAG: hypothetical protein BWY36_00590 [Candidatus Diapherotrites archaeon ADurb.Bin253]|jgi:hypothetical protein|nr:hypothetical protein [Candidatus Pacearchaeota archaeon]OQA67911.1 MAG: hypothetical protein BWY36_00590 [Candidatus Diapherotrites archaeon ADurb.Bin253]